jgi:hypothetical protein
MKIGITGHQRRSGIDWAWVRDRIDSELQTISAPIEGLSSLAEGADQVFAEVILDRGGKLRAVIPTPDYERYFSENGIKGYNRLKLFAKAETLTPEADHERSFYKAGRYIADHVDLLFAVWDGEPAKGLGGTADIVSYATLRGKPVIHINPIDRTVHHLAAEI